MNMTATRENHVDDGQNGAAALQEEVRRCAEQIAELTQKLEDTRTELERVHYGLWELRLMTFRYRWRKFTSHRLTAYPHYPAHQLYVPQRYTRLPKLAQPPAIAIVTPSFRQGHFLERTMKSVLDQEYPRLEYAVQDGGSEDETVSVLGRYEGRLRHWASHADRGQAHAINLGFQHVQGEIMAYLNSDDLLLPGALHYAADYFQRHPK